MLKLIIITACLLLRTFVFALFFFVIQWVKRTLPPATVALPHGCVVWGTWLCSQTMQSRALYSAWDRTKAGVSRIQRPHPLEPPDREAEQSTGAENLPHTACCLQNTMALTYGRACAQSAALFLSGLRMMEAQRAVRQPLPSTTLSVVLGKAGCHAYSLKRKKAGP